MMADHNDAASHTLEWMRRISAKLDTLSLDIGDLKLRQSAVEDHLSGITVSLAGVTHRMDRMEGRLDRIERRLDLRDGEG